jgi:hypothetical protein
MLETEEDGEEDWDLIVETIKWSDIVFVFAVERPDVGCDQINVVL